MRRNPYLEAVCAELEAAGVDHLVVTSGRHFKIRFTLPSGRQFQVVVPCSGSDRRGVKNARALTRRLLRSEP